MNQGVLENESFPRIEEQKMMAGKEEVPSNISTKLPDTVR
jgi:hypothetical protein